MRAFIVTIKSAEIPFGALGNRALRLEVDKNSNKCIYHKFPGLNYHTTIPKKVRRQGNKLWLSSSAGIF
jgi:hypothetical protein